MHFFLVLQTLKLNGKNRKTKDNKVWRGIDFSLYFLNKLKKKIIGKEESGTLFVIFSHLSGLYFRPIDLKNWKKRNCFISIFRFQLESLLLLRSRDIKTGNNFFVRNNSFYFSFRFIFDISFLSKTKI